MEASVEMKVQEFDALIDQVKILMEMQKRLNVCLISDAETVVFYSVGDFTDIAGYLREKVMLKKIKEGTTEAHFVYKEVMVSCYIFEFKTEKELLERIMAQKGE